MMRPTPLPATLKVRSPSPLPLARSIACSLSPLLLPSLDRSPVFSSPRSLARFSSPDRAP